MRGYKSLWVLGWTLWLASTVGVVRADEEVKENEAVSEESSEESEELLESEEEGPAWRKVTTSQGWIIEGVDGAFEFKIILPDELKGEAFFKERLNLEDGWQNYSKWHDRVFGDFRELWSQYEGDLLLNLEKLSESLVQKSAELLDEIRESDVSEEDVTADSDEDVFEEDVEADSEDGGSEADVSEHKSDLSENVKEIHKNMDKILEHTHKKLKEKIKSAHEKWQKHHYEHYEGFYDDGGAVAPYCLKWQAPKRRAFGKKGYHKKFDYDRSKKFKGDDDHDEDADYDEGSHSGGWADHHVKERSEYYGYKRSLPVLPGRDPVLKLLIQEFVREVFQSPHFQGMYLSRDRGGYLLCAY